MVRSREDRNEVGLEGSGDGNHGVFQDRFDGVVGKGHLAEHGDDFLLRGAGAGLGLGSFAFGDVDADPDVARYRAVLDERGDRYSGIDHAAIARLAPDFARRRPA